MYNNILVTGGAGFIGSAFIRRGLARDLAKKIINFDLLTYAADLGALVPFNNDSRYHFEKGDVCDEALVHKLCETYGIEAIVHFAAETHVDRSIAGPYAFLETNVRGTFALLEVVRRLRHIHFHHVSTDEVYGALGSQGQFSECSPYLPNSPYAASKAAADHFVRAYAKTYGLSTTISHCSNNFGPYQHDEKFLPTIIRSCLSEQQIPVYGAGKNVRDWLYVDDHVDAVWTILAKGKAGDVYNIGGRCELENLAFVNAVIHCFPQEKQGLYHKLIHHVDDRPGHDFRYSIDDNKIRHDLGWSPHWSFQDALRTTLNWYMKKYENSLRYSC